MPRKHRRPAGRAQIVALSLLGITVVGAPLLLGGVPAWARLSIGAASWLSLVAAIWTTRDGRPGGRAGAWLGLGLALVAFTSLQVVPLPLSWLAGLAPESAAAVVSTRRALGLDAPAWGALSMDPGATLAALLQGLGLLCAAVAAWLLAGAGRRRALLWLVVLSAGAMAFVALGHEAAGADKIYGIYEPRFVHPHPLAPLLNLNHLAALLSLGAVLSLGLAAELRGGRRVAASTLAIVLVATTLLTGSRGGVASLLGAVVLFGMLARFESRRAGVSARLGVAAALALGVSLGAYLALEPLLRQLGDTSVDNKLEVAQQGLSIALRHPWIGVGRGAFGSASSLVWGTTTRALYPESLPVQWAAEWGIPVALAALGVLGACVAGLFRGRRSPARLAAAIALVMLFAHELVDFSTEIAGVGTVAAVLFGATVGRSSRRAGRVSSLAAPLALALVSLVALAALGPRATRTDSRGEQEALEALLSAGQPAQFQRRLVQDMLAHPQEAAFALIGGAEAVGRDAPEALPLLNRAMLLAPGWASPHELTARWLLRHGRRDQALLELRQAAMRDDRLSAPLLCQLLRRSPAAELALRAAPTGGEGLPLLNRAARCMRRFPAVAQAIDAEILRREPDAMAPQLRAIERLRRAGELDSALGRARELRRRHAEDAQITLVEAQLLVEAQRGDEALRLLQTPGLILDPAEILRVEARAYAVMGDAPGMRQAIDGLRGLAAGRARPLAAALREQGRLEVSLGNRAQGLVAFGRAQRLDPRPSGLLAIARLAEQLGAMGRARRAYRELLRDAPDNASYRRGLARTGGRPTP